MSCTQYIHVRARQNCANLDLLPVGPCPCGSGQCILPTGHYPHSIGAAILTFTPPTGPGQGTICPAQITQTNAQQSFRPNIHPYLPREIVQPFIDVVAEIHPLRTANQGALAHRIRRAIPGMRETTAAAIRIKRPEIGTRGRKQIASLVGPVPMTRPQNPGSGCIHARLPFRLAGFSRCLHHIELKEKNFFAQTRHGNSKTWQTGGIG